VDSFQVASAVTLDQRLLVRTSIRNHKAVSLELDGQKTLLEFPSLTVNEVKEWVNASPKSVRSRKGTC